MSLNSVMRTWPPVRKMWAMLKYTIAGMKNSSDISPTPSSGALKKYRRNASSVVSIVIANSAAYDSHRNSVSTRSCATASHDRLCVIGSANFGLDLLHVRVCAARIREAAAFHLLDHLLRR